MEEKQKKEKIYYSSGNTLVSESKVIIGGKAIKIADIEEASVAVSVKRVSEGIIMLVIGFVILLIGFATHASIVLVLGLVFALLGGISIVVGYIKPVYYVKIKTHSGSLAPYSAETKGEIEEIVASINNAVTAYAEQNG